MYCIIANFGDDSVALIQHVYELQLSEVFVLSVDTGWSSSTWNTRIEKAEQWINSLGFKHFHLKSENKFSELVQARMNFPSTQFNWCAGFLKGITILNWLEENDENCTSTILLPNRREMSKAQADLPYKIEESGRYDSRTVEYLLADLDTNMRNLIIAKTPFKNPLNHRSLECQPCIHLTRRDIQLFSSKDTTRIIKLENCIKQSMFSEEFSNYLLTLKEKPSNNYYDEFSKTCGWYYGCGL